MIRPGLVLRLLLLESRRDEPRYGLSIERYQQRDLIRAAARRYALTAREIEVLEMLMLGEPTNAMAARLSIAETTVQQHVKNLGAKIGVTTRMAIVGVVLRSS